MGAWGVGPFDNDASGDALDELGAAGARALLSLVEEKLAKIADSTGRLDSWETEQALAAAALVAASTGAPGALHPTAVEFLSSHPIESTAELRVLAARTIERALTERDNEWYELWVLSAGLAEAREALEPFQDVLSR
jgi:hypothetical protein